MEQDASGEELDIEARLVKADVAERLFHGRRPVRLGRFELVRRLGRGGMGVVYEALDTERGERVALKSLPRLEPRAIYRLKREFRALGELRDPHLVRLHELFALGRRWFFTMELLEGEPFDRYARPGGELDLPRLWRTLPQLARAVSSLHAAGKLHCDLKPANVLVSATGQLKVLDFGLSAEIGAQDSHSRGGMLGGTPAYMGPELLQGAMPSEASDWYAVGVMLYEALSGRRPFSGNVFEMRAAKLESAAEPLPEALPQELRELCSELLHRDADRRPRGAAIASRLQSASPPIAAIASLSPPQHARPFLGREAELAMLHDALTQAKAGRQRLVLLEGGSGMGKSALLSRFAAQVGSDALVLQGRCYPQESVPYKALDAVVDALGRKLQRLPHEQVVALLPRHVRALSRLFPSLERVTAVAEAPEARDSGDARELRSRAFSALKEVLLRLSDRQPVAVLVDDLQWADVDSARLLSALLGEPEPPPIVFVGAYRGDEREHGEFLQQALTEGGALSQATVEHRLELGPLDDLTAQRLAQQLSGGSLSAERAAALAREARGVPFFIGELVEHARCHSSEAPRLNEVVHERVAALRPEARALLRVLAVAAAPIEQRAAVQAARLDQGGRAAIDQLCATRLARTRGPGTDDLAETYHDRIREAVVNAMPRAAIAQTHARIARALETNKPGEPERLVEHYAAAGENERAGEAAREAARAAAEKLAFNRAAQLYRRAIDLLGEDAVGWKLHRKLGDALANAGRGAQAADAYVRAAQSASSAEHDELKKLAARQYLRSGRIEQGRALAREVLGKRGISLPHSPSATLRALLWQRLVLSRTKVTCPGPARPASEEQLARLDALGAISSEMLVPDILSGTLLHSLYLREALRHGDRNCRAHALAWEAFTAALTGGRSGERRAIVVLGACESMVGGGIDAHREVSVALARAATELFSGRAFDAALEEARRARELCARLGSAAAWERGVANFMLFIAAEFTGPLTLILEHVDDVSRDARERDDDFVQLLMLLAIPYARLMADDRDGAMRFLRDLEPRLGSEYAAFRHLWTLRTAEALLYEAQPRTAYEFLQTWWPRFRRSAHFQSEFVRQSFDFYWSRAATASFVLSGDLKYARHALQLVARLARRHTAYSAYARSLLGTIKQLQGRSDWAADFVLGERLVQSCGAPLAAMVPRWARARLQGDRSGVDEMLTLHREQGVLAPERWLWSLCPAGPPPTLRG